MNVQVPMAVPSFRHPHPSSTFLSLARHPAVLPIHSGITGRINEHHIDLTKSRVLQNLQSTTFLLIHKISLS